MYGWVLLHLYLPNYVLSGTCSILYIQFVHNFPNFNTYPIDCFGSFNHCWYTLAVQKMRHCILTESTSGCACREARSVVYSGGVCETGDTGIIHVHLYVGIIVIMTRIPLPIISGTVAVERERDVT